VTLRRVGATGSHDLVMPPAAREFFTVDLRGLRAALARRAAEEGVTETHVLRSALAAAIGDGRKRLPGPATDSALAQPTTAQVKLSVRLARPVAHLLDQNARASGLSRGAYLARLIRGAPPVMASADRAAACRALNNSSEGLALLSRDICRLLPFMRRDSLEAARIYLARQETLEKVVQAHLTLAAAVLADLSSMFNR
jgi:hypothetical protein